MRASLHSDIRVSGSTLLDARLGLRYTLTPDAAWLVGLLVHEGQLEVLTTAVGRSRGLSRVQSFEALCRLFGQLAGHGVLTLTREVTDGVALNWRFLWRWPRRYSVRLGQMARAIGRAYGVVGVPLAVGCVVAWCVAPIWLSSSLLALAAVLVASFVVHELGHIGAARVARVPVVLLARPGYMAVLYKRPNALRACCIAAAGPLLAVSGCMCLAALWPSRPAQIFLLLVGSVHALSVLPFFADGKTIWRRT